MIIVVIEADWELPNLIEVRDELRARDWLRRSKCCRRRDLSIMLTGGHDCTAQALAADSGILSMHAGRSPQTRLCHQRPRRR